MTSTLVASIPGSTNIPIDELRERLDEIGVGPVLVYCEVGQRGHVATTLLHELGIAARNLDGGFTTWAADRRASGVVLAAAPA